MEEKKSKKTIIVSIAVIIICFFVGFFVGRFIESDSKNKNDDKKESNEKIVEDDEKKEDVIDDGKNEEVNIPVEIKEKIDKFILAASYVDDSFEISNYDEEHDKSITIYHGLEGVTDNQKLKIVYSALYNYDKKYTQLTNSTVPEKYKGDSYWNLTDDSMRIYQISIQDFKDEYLYLFGSNVVLSSPDYIGGCPHAFKIDEELGYIYLSNQCGGDGTPYYFNKTYKYAEDNNYYYVYQYVGMRLAGTKTFKKISSGDEVQVDSFEGNEDKFETLVWKFDKKGYFISTENIG